MEKIFTCLLFFLTSISAYSQSKIESVGFGSISVKPDIGILTLNFNSIKPDIKSAVENLNRETKQATEQLSKLGLEKINQTTRNFGVRVNKIYEQGKTRDSGYVASQQVEVKFKNSKVNVSKILSSFLDDYRNLNFNFSFDASDSLKHAVENRIVELATKDAIEKAQILARSAKLTLGKIIEIKRGSVPFFGMSQSGLTEDLNSVEYSAKIAGFEANDISFSDKVLIIFETK